MKFLVETEEYGILTADVDARDRRAFEKTGYRDLGIAQRIAIKEVIALQPESYMAWLAWHALVRDGRKESWVEFEPKVISVVLNDVVETEDALADPTMRARLGG